MKAFYRKWLGSRLGGETGFTLVELLVVVGIIVALAAVIIPNVARFSSKGTEGAKNAEEENVQTAFDTLLADEGISVLLVSTDSNTSSSINVWTAEPSHSGLGASPQNRLDDYLRSTTTVYYYCFDNTAKVTRQDEVSTACP